VALPLALVFALAALLVLPFVVLGLAMPRPGQLAPLPAARTLAVQEGTWRYEEAGSGEQVLLLLHGFNQDAGAWDDVWNQLGACRCRRIRVDLPGFGASRFEGDDFSLGRQALRLGEFLDALGVERVTLVGVSMGGSLAAWFAAVHPGRVARLVLLAPSGYEGALTHGGVFGRLLQPGRANQAATWLARTRLYAVLFPRSVALQALTVSASYGRAWVEALPRISAPTIVAWAKDDPVANASVADAIAQAIPRATLVWFDAAAGHALPQSRPRQVADLLGAPAGTIQR
jgi:pimeloyl-ACP methyl ester carboxylesterase